MAYNKHPPKSRRYQKNHTANDNKSSHYEKMNPDEPAALPLEAEAVNTAARSKKSSPIFGFINSFLGGGDRCEKSGRPIFNILDHDIYLDDLILAGLILLLLTDKIDDELLLVILLYLLVDIF